jgi:hypothetical protein
MMPLGASVTDAASRGAAKVRKHLDRQHLAAVDATPKTPAAADHRGVERSLNCIDNSLGNRCPWAEQGNSHRVTKFNMRVARPIPDDQRRPHFDRISVQASTCHRRVAADHAEAQRVMIGPASAQQVP